MTKGTVVTSNEPRKREENDTYAERVEAQRKRVNVGDRVAYKGDYKDNDWTIYRKNEYHVTLVNGDGIKECVRYGRFHEGNNS